MLYCAREKCRKAGQSDRLVSERVTDGQTAFQLDTMLRLGSYSLSRIEPPLSLAGAPIRYSIEPSVRLQCVPAINLFKMVRNRCSLSALMRSVRDGCCPIEVMSSFRRCFSSVAQASKSSGCSWKICCRQGLNC